MSASAACLPLSIYYKRHWLFRKNKNGFLQKLAACPGIRYVHPPKEHSWGQRVVRFYDPDLHIIEVGEAMPAVARRFQDRGMTTEQIAARMDVPCDAVLRWLRAEPVCGASADAKQN